MIRQGFVGRYFLQTDIARTLTAAGCRLVALVPNPKDPAVIAYFALHGFDVAPLREAKYLDTDSSFAPLLRRARRFALDGRGSRAFANRYEASRRRFKERNSRLYSVVLDAFIRGVLWRSPRARRWVMRREMRHTETGVHSDLFERHRPALVVASGPGYFRHDAAVLREARERGVPAGAVVFSWDNPTSKGYRGADVDLVTAWSQRMADQLAAFQDIDRKRIEVVGVAHWDHYLRDGGPEPTREEICKAVGLGPARRLITFACNSPGSHEANLAVSRAIAEAIDAGRLGDAQLVIRPHPNYLGQGADEASLLIDLEAWAVARPHVALNRPLVGDVVLRAEFDPGDAVILAGLMKHSDVVVNLFSSTSLEAMLCDTPVVAVDSDSVSSVGRRVPEGGSRFSEFAHSTAVERGARVAHDLEELIEHVRAYLDDPSLDREGRRAVVAQECGPLDGRSGYRTAAKLLELIGVDPPPFEAVVEGRARSQRTVERESEVVR